MGLASIKGVALNYRLSGPEGGSPLVLVNSLGTDMSIWDEVLPLVAPRYRVLTYDKRGHGVSAVPVGPYRIDDHVDDLVGLADHCGFSSFALCGISIGGMIALRTASRYPERMQKIVLCDTGSSIGTASMWNDRIAAVQRGGMDAIADAVLERWVSPGFREKQPAAFARWRRTLGNCPADGYIANCAAVRDAELSADLENISADALVIAGEHDLSTPPEVAKTLASGIRRARLSIIAEAGHIPAIERPDVLGRLIGDFLREVAYV